MELWSIYLDCSEVSVIPVILCPGSSWDRQIGAVFNLKTTWQSDAAHHQINSEFISKYEENSWIAYISLWIYCLLEAFPLMLLKVTYLSLKLQIWILSIFTEKFKPLTEFQDEGDFSVLCQLSCFLIISLYHLYCR